MGFSKKAKLGEMTLPVKVVVIAAKRLGLNKEELKRAVYTALGKTTLTGLSGDDASKVLSVLADVAKAGCWEKYAALNKYNRRD